MNFEVGDRVYLCTAREYIGTVVSVSERYLGVMWDHHPSREAVNNAIDRHRLLERPGPSDGFEFDA